MMESFFDKFTGRTRVQVLSRRALEPEAKRIWIKSYKDGPGPSPALYNLAAATDDGPGDMMPGPPEPCWIVRSDNLTGRTHVQVLSRRELEPDAEDTWNNSYKDEPGPSTAFYNLAAATHDGPGDLMPGSPQPCWIHRSDEPETSGDKKRSSGSRWRKRLRSIFCMSRESVKVTPFTPAFNRPSTKNFGCQVTEEELSPGPKVTMIQVKPMKRFYMVDASTQVDEDEISSFHS
ncbi:uncharacterized protein [Engystomops pustulosus]|uniref:uncharacterized protein n=1 Tax=Engystomops pustulosus TaxID=76066 RepID=UPI003AFA21D7